ncbi:interleukin-1 receptor type 1-like isoform X2 [Eucyclogobius newberryi]|uniref:interleukin-1 receptor type 1-like isoform X2 n=1 Tax=Eucyclogobius newberryi TaxID=166745 RepID=UPI003B5BA5FD
MAPTPEALSLLLLCSLLGPGSSSEPGGCQNYYLQFERVFSVPGDVAMLNSTLLSPSVFNLSAEPYNITWYRLNSDQPISNQSGRVLVLAETLWFLNVSLGDAGDYVTVVRTPGMCYRQQTKLVVDTPLSLCGRPRTAGQRLTKGVTDRLSCPLKDYIHKLTSYGLPFSITWYKGCERVAHQDQGRFHYWDTYLKVEEVQSEDQALYTCTLTFSLGGVNGGVSETIEAEVQGDYCLLPQVREPANDVVKAELGSNLTKRCLVFVPCEGRPLLDMDMYWLVQDNFIMNDPSERVYSTQQRIVQKQDRGVWMELWLIISELKEVDFKLNYTCRVWSGRGSPYCYFTLLHTDPDLLLPVGVALGSCLLLFLLCVSVYHVFKVDLVLWSRGTFPGFHRRTASDGKLYDAYVAFPQSDAAGWSDEVERFALHTLPQVLEEACGFSLFIPGRDCRPGEAVIDMVEENLQASRRILLLYTASTFSKKHCSNNNTLQSRPMTHHTETSHQLYISKEHLNTSKEHLNTSKDHLNTNKDHLDTNKEHLNTSKVHLNTNKDHLQQNMSREQLSTNNNIEGPLNTWGDQLSISLNLLNTSMNSLATGKDHLQLDSSRDHLSTNNNIEGPVNTRQDQLSISLNSLNHLNTSMCGHAQTHLECVAAMHRALMERSLKVILVELEELGPCDVEQLPESVRYLRQTQGAVCWWKTQRTAKTCWRTVCMRRTGNTWDTETPLSSCVSPNCRFWKEVRYRMPV